MKTKDIRYLKAKSLQNQPKTIYIHFHGYMKIYIMKQSQRKIIEIFNIYYDVSVQLN